MFWYLYKILASLAIAVQCFFSCHTYQNYRFALKKSRKTDLIYLPVTLLTIPCKGIDNTFEKNVSSFFELDYPDYYLHFVVESEDDPAYQQLQEIKEKLSGRSHAKDVRILVAGLSEGCSQKIHNLLHSCANSPEDVEVYSFADSDVCADRHWLSHIVHPLRKSKHGASSGYRWFVPSENNLASLVLSAMNAKVTQLLGKNQFTQAWGGSMAIRRKTFYEIGIDKIWPSALSDDLSLSWAVKRNGMRVVFVPGCLVASYEKTTWAGLFEFARRQFLITRVITPGTWWFGFGSLLFSLLGLWGGVVVAVIAIMTGQSYRWLYLLMPVVFLVSQVIRSYLRQKMIAKVLPHEACRMRPAMLADILGTCIWSWLLFVLILLSAFGRTITWRGIRYRLKGPTETEIIN